MSRKLAPHQIRSSLRLAINHSGLALLSTAVLCSMASGSLTIVGAPGYDSATGTGYKIDTINLAFQPGSPLIGNGVAVGYADKYTSTVDVGPRAMRWDGSGAGIELENLGVNGSGFTSMPIFSVNFSGISVGGANKYVSGSQVGSPAVRWSSTGVATELGGLGLNATGSTVSRAYSINSIGTSAGWSSKFESGINKGTRAVRWDSSSTTAFELGNLGLSATGVTNAEAYAINSLYIVGFSEKYVSGNLRGTRAVRWSNADGTAFELGALGLDSSSSTDAIAYDTDGNLVTVGMSEKYTSGTYNGTRAVRWSSSSVATEMGNLGLGANGYTESAAYSTTFSEAVGYAQKYVSETLKGTRAVRWAGVSAIELETLGTDASGVTNARALVTTDSGTAAGWSEKYTASGSLQGTRAVVWLPDSTVVDLNDLGLPAPAGDGDQWDLLTSASAITEDGWVTGTGRFLDFHGSGFSSYNRRFVTQVGLGGEWQGLNSGNLNGVWGRGMNWSSGTPAMQVGKAIFNIDDDYVVTLDRDEFTQSITVNAGEVQVDFAGHNLSTEILMVNSADLTLGNVGQSLSAETVEIYDGQLAVGGDVSIDRLGSHSDGRLWLTQSDVIVSEPLSSFTSGLTVIVFIEATMSARLRGLFNLEVIGTFDVGDSTSIHGFRSDGIIEVVDHGMLEIRDRDFAVLGTETTLGGGTIIAANGLSLGSGRALLGHGSVEARFSAATGSFIEADGDLTIGADTPNGFATFGELHVGSHTMTLVDSNQAVLGAGSWTTLDAGTLDAETSADGLLIDFGATITGSGVILAPNDPFNPTMLNGEVIGDSLASPIEIGGFVRGVGSVDNVVFTGTYSPGFSPAQVFVGNFGYSSSSTAIMELGGETPGSEHDQIVSSGTIQLNGTLQLDVINNYDPEYGVAHEIFSAMQIVGLFAEVDGVQFATDKYLAVSYDSDSVFVTAALPGDANLDGEVGFADLLTVAQNYDLDGMSWVTGDFDGTGIIGFSDLLLAAQNYGMTLIEGELTLDFAMNARFDADWQLALTSVPEPGALGVLATSLLALHRRRRV